MLWMKLEQLYYQLINNWSTQLTTLMSIIHKKKSIALNIVLQFFLTILVQEAAAVAVSQQLSDMSLTQQSPSSYTKSFLNKITNRIVKLQKNVLMK